MATIWTQADIDALAAAIRAFATADPDHPVTVQSVSYAGPPQRTVTYHKTDLAQMRALLAEMVRDVNGSPTHRIARHTKGFR